MDGSEPDTRPGTYALLLRIDAVATVAIGRRNQMILVPGWEIYIGSAFGPGGVRARLAHHRRCTTRPHWHIDSLRQHGRLAAVWFSHDPARRECLWAKTLAVDLGGQAPSFRFGASDCRCPAHLHRFRERPHLSAFIAALRARAPDHAAVLEGK